MEKKKTHFFFFFSTAAGKFMEIPLMRGQSMSWLAEKMRSTAELFFCERPVFS